MADDGQGQKIADDLQHTFNFKAAREKMSQAMDSVKGALGVKPAAPAKQDTTWHDQQVREANASFRNSQPAPDSAKNVVPKYKHGTDYVPKTGPAILHKGEAVLNKDDAEQHRAAKGAGMSHWAGNVKDELGGDKGEKPAKKISHMVHRKSHNGDHIFEHHHTHPEHHPMETHTKRGDDEMVEHMLAHAGTPNPGEPEANAGQPDAYSQAGQAGAAGAPAAGPAAAGPAEAMGV